MDRTRLLAPLAGLAVLLAGCAAPPPADGGPPGAAPPVAGPAVVRSLGGGDNNVYDPVKVGIEAGGQVRWDGISGHHTVSFERDINGNGTAPESGNLAPGSVYTLSFPTPGTYRYRCLYHSFGFNLTEGMVGAVTVTAGA